MDSTPCSSNNITVPSHQHSIHTNPINNNTSSYMVGDVQGAVDELNSVGSAMTGAMTQAENTAVDIPAMSVGDDVDLYAPDFLDDFLPGGIYHDEFYLNTNLSSQNQPSIMDNDPNTGEMPIQVDPADQQCAEGQLQQSMFDDLAAGDEALVQARNTYSASEGYEDQSQDAEGSPDPEYAFEDLIGFDPSVLYAEDFPAAGTPHEGHSQLLHGQSDSPFAVDGFHNGISQAAVGTLQNSSSQIPGPLASNSSSHVPLRAHTDALGRTTSSAPSKTQGRTCQEETRWENDTFQHRMHPNEDWRKFH